MLGAHVVKSKNEQRLSVPATPRLAHYLADLERGPRTIAVQHNGKSIRGDLAQKRLEKLRHF